MSLSVAELVAQNNFMRIETTSRRLAVFNGSS